jgi:von Willebrand factor type A domain
LAALVLVAAALVAACSGGGDTGATNSAGSGGSQSAGSHTGSSGMGGDIGVGSLAGPAGSGSGAGGGCAGTSSKAQLLPLDMYVMLDQSGSMSTAVNGGGTRWTAVTGALTTFVNQPNLNGVSVGIQYFPLKVGGLDSCNTADYANPAVEIAPLPGVANTIITSMGQHAPAGNTPTSAALDGAITHAIDWQNKNPTHVTIVVFATDGQPTECDTNLQNIYGIAAAGFNGMPKIPTYVIGVGSSGNLNGIAVAGGTMAAFQVDTNGNANQDFLDAMNKIRGSVLACSYLIPAPPAGQMLDYSKVNVEYTPGAGGSPITIPKVMDKASCPSPGLGWYYDDNAKPTQIILCDDTCKQISADSKAAVNIVLGCGTILK